jgi:hypothetical protein
MHLKVFMKLEKTLKPLSSWQKNPKKSKKTQKTQKNPKKPKKPTGLGFFKKTRVFSNPGSQGIHLFRNHQRLCRKYRTDLILKTFKNIHLWTQSLQEITRHNIFCRLRYFFLPNKNKIDFSSCVHHVPVLILIVICISGTGTKRSNDSTAGFRTCC